MLEMEYCLGIPDPLHRKRIVSALSLIGMRCVGEGRDCPHLLRVVRKIQPQLVLIDLSLPGNVLETASIIDQETLTAVLLLERPTLEETITATCNVPIIVLPLPVNEQVLHYVVDVLLLESERRKKLQQEVRELRAKLQSRIVIERAKGIVMKELSLNEQQAYRFLQKKSMDLRLPIKEVAEAVFNGDMLISLK
jgi:response regulator NasT